MILLSRAVFHFSFRFHYFKCMNVLPLRVYVQACVPLPMEVRRELLFLGLELQLVVIFVRAGNRSQALHESSKNSQTLNQFSSPGAVL